MWTWILVIMILFLILVLFEELIEFLVNRFILGPASWEGKIKRFLHSLIGWFKRKGKRPFSLK
ncbi:hypothetical protein J27TS8_09040 [Robertmurraya siralis]|uniref:Uncharacterized protein n=1 Tax=Robertmurraya siralis TaxID=77777 RepID=A0A919WFB0_9BACI|nr:hypothetical protein [Robertmurraya siralis]PAE22377.1 hypothetical protein CHH80_01560 [Bacillus sp. 7504-2]GIN60911.1 hypothetical protein J27TS8_09040 [Robertmurraya siralis]